MTTIVESDNIIFLFSVISVTSFDLHIELVVLTGASSGLGRKTAQGELSTEGDLVHDLERSLTKSIYIFIYIALLRSGDYHVVGAVRDLDKMEAVAELDGFDMDNFTPMHLELNSFESVHKFCDELSEFKMTKPIDRLICNAGVYQPTLPYAKWSADGHEQTMQVNFLSHFLMIR